MNFTRFKIESSKKSKYLQMENPHVKKIIVDVDDSGALVIPKSAPDYVKDWVRTE